MTWQARWVRVSGYGLLIAIVAVAGTSARGGNIFDDIESLPVRSPAARPAATTASTTPATASEPPPPTGKLAGGEKPDAPTVSLAALKTLPVPSVTEQAPARKLFKEA